VRTYSRIGHDDSFTKRKTIQRSGKIGSNEQSQQVLSYWRYIFYCSNKTIAAFQNNRLSNKTKECIFQKYFLKFFFSFFMKNPRFK
jgi:hypothetical protein